MEIQREVKSFIALWIKVVASLCYSHTVAKFTPAGISRFLAILPIVCLFLWIPLTISSALLVGITSFMVAWVSTFNLLLLAFGKGRLSSDSPPLPLLSFVLMACLPINIKQSSSSDNKSHYVERNPNEKHRSSSSLNSPALKLATKIMIFAILMRVYGYKESVHPKMILLAYFVHFYLLVEIMFGLFAILAQSMALVEVTPHFNKPYLATSLQDFWSRRWNLMVSGLLHAVVYIHVRSLSGRFLPKKCAVIPGLLATFLVSGLMHELIFFYMGRLKPNWHVTWFFIVQGSSVAIEIVVKRTTDGKFHIPAMVSRPLTLGFLALTASWLFFPPILRSKQHVKACAESIALIKLIYYGQFVRPEDISCPFF